MTTLSTTNTNALSSLSLLLLSSSTTKYNSQSESELSSNDDQQHVEQQLQQHFQEKLLYDVKNRPTRKAAYEFLNNTTSSNSSSYCTIFDWKTIPKRLQVLCNTIHNWEREYDEMILSNQNQQQQNNNNDENDENKINSNQQVLSDELLFYDSCQYNNKKDAIKDARINSMTASLLVMFNYKNMTTMTMTPSSSDNDESSVFFFKSFESLFRASLDFRDTIQQHQQSLSSNNDSNNNEYNADEKDTEIMNHEYLDALFYNNTTSNTENQSLQQEHEQERSIQSWISIEQQLFSNIRKTGWIRSSSSSSSCNRRSTKCLLHNELCQAIYKTIVQKLKVLSDADEVYSNNLYTDRVLYWKEHVIEPWLMDLLHGPTSIIHQQSSSSSSLSSISKQQQQQQQQQKLKNHRSTTSILLEDVEVEWKLMVDQLVSETYLSVRMEQIFSIVTDYPYSIGTVLELKVLLEKTTNQHTELAKQLRTSLIRKLNHPGATTSQIIAVYIDTIKVLRIIDPSDRLLTVVAAPVRTYLRGRTDTIRCIITNLTNVDSDLYQELRRQDVKPLENVTYDSDEDDDTPPDMYNWQPLPSINKPQGTFLSPVLNTKSNTTTTSSANDNTNDDNCDILAMLVSIYGSKELFVDEYRLMLADKLLANLDYSTDNEVHTLELLKLRFGETSMRNCEVMIKDMDDSKRTNTLIHSSILASQVRKCQQQGNNPDLNNIEELTTSSSVVDAVMFSHIFWPTLQNRNPIKHHPRLQSKLDEFTDMYAKLKNPRKLEWMNQLGTVQLELQVIETTTTKSDDGNKVSTMEAKQFTCSPLLATLISHFEDKAIWTSIELANETGIQESIIQKRMAYWVSNNVLISSIRRISSTAATISNESSSTGSSCIVYELASQAVRDQQQQNNNNNQNQNQFEYGDDDDNNTNAVSASIQEQEEMILYESFITAMLTNIGSCTLERIHNMLKMFISSGGGSDTGMTSSTYNKSQQQLAKFLQNLCKQDKLEYSPDGMYKLIKKETTT